MAEPQFSMTAVSSFTLKRCSIWVVLLVFGMVLGRLWQEAASIMAEISPSAICGGPCPEFNYCDLETWTCEECRFRCIGFSRQVCNMFQGCDVGKDTVKFVCVCVCVYVCVSVSALNTN